MEATVQLECHGLISQQHDIMMLHQYLDVCRTSSHTDIVSQLVGATLLCSDTASRHADAASEHTDANITTSQLILTAQYSKTCRKQPLRELTENGWLMEIVF